MVLDLRTYSRTSTVPCVLFCQVPADRREDTQTSLAAVTGHSVVPAPVTSREGAFGLHGFFIPLGPVGVPRTLPYALNAPTTSKNLVRKREA